MTKPRPSAGKVKGDGDARFLLWISDWLGSKHPQYKRHAVRLCEIAKRLEQGNVE